MKWMRQNAILTLEHTPTPVILRKVAFYYMGKRYEPEIVEFARNFGTLELAILVGRKKVTRIQIVSLFMVTQTKAAIY